MAVLLPVTAVAVVVGLATCNRWVSNREMERARKELLDRVRAERGSMPPDSVDFLPKVESWITRLAGAYKGDLVTEPIHSTPALQAQLARNGLFIHGPAEKLANPERLPEVASSSVKDSFLLCMFDPPESRADKTVLSKVRGVNFAAVAPNIRRFYEAEAGLYVLQPPWEARLRAAQELKLLASFKGELARAPIEDGKRAAKAELLIVVIDDPPVHASADSDAQPPHSLRVAIVDLFSQTELLRLRTSVDLSSMPAATRAAHGRAVAGCLAAAAVQDAVKN